MEASIRNLSFSKNKKYVAFSRYFQKISKFEFEVKKFKDFIK
jgi:hypothetical protein